jgi:HK97 family phage prohead protease
MVPAADDDRAVTVTCSTETLGRDKIVLMSRGIDLNNFRANPVWLWQHNADWPVARSSEISVQGTNLVSRVRFPPAGVSARADEVLGLIRAGIINGASTGFEKVQAEPIEGGGTRIKSCELAEMSFVSIPAVPDALVTERARRREEDNMRLSRAQHALAAQFRRDLANPVKSFKPAKVRRRSVRRHSMLFHRHMASLFAAELRRTR